MKKNLTITPSSAASWANCARSKNYDRQAAWGVLLHEIAAALLQGDEEKADFLKTNSLYNQKGSELVRFYINYLNTRAQASEVFVESCVKQKINDFVIKGRIDALIMLDQKLEVVDFKTSASDIDWNQMFIYAYMAASLFRVDAVRVTVVQSQNKSKIKTRFLTSADLHSVRKDIIDKLEGMPLDCRPSQNCKTCGIGNICIDRYNYFVEMLPCTANISELVRFIKMKKQIQEAFKDAEKILTTSLMDGVEIDGVELQNKRVNRFIKPEDTYKAFDILSEALSEKDLKAVTKVNLSISKAEKILGKEKVFDLIGHLIQRKTGEKVLKIIE